MAEEEQKPAALRMPEVNPYVVAQDDYTYEPKAKDEGRKGLEGQTTQSGGMSSQFEMVSNPLNKNI
jgi:hypothetical protein